MSFENPGDSGERLRAQLRQEREQVLAELRAYPPAVPACDAQFNYLLEQRDRLGRALGRLDAILGAELEADEWALRLADFQHDFVFFVAKPATS